MRRFGLVACLAVAWLQMARSSQQPRVAVLACRSTTPAAAKTSSTPNTAAPEKHEGVQEDEDEEDVEVERQLWTRSVETILDPVQVAVQFSGEHLCLNKKYCNQFAAIFQV